jgi:two-component sensor histidine kinase
MNGGALDWFRQRRASSGFWNPMLRNDLGEAKQVNEVAGADLSSLDRLKRALPRVGSPFAFVVAVIAVGLGVLARLPLDAWAGAPLPPYITFSPAIVIAGLAGGVRAGLVACALAIIIAWYNWVGPSGTWEIRTTRDALTIGVYAITGSLMAIVSGGARLLLDRLAVSEAERALVARETVHRIKNLVAVVQVLSHRAAKGSQTVDEFRERLDNKLAALAIAQNMLVRRDWHDAPLDELISKALAPFLIHSKIRVAGGPPVVLPREYVSGLTMALYELATNSLKYGALAADGDVTVSWTCSASHCVLFWIERGSTIAPRTGSGGGFGQRLIRAAFGGAAGTSVDYDLKAAEVICRFEWPLPTTSKIA